MDNALIHARLADAAGKYLSADKIENAKPLTGGAASTTWRFDAVSGANRRTLILRCTQAVEQISTGLSKPQEAVIQQSAYTAGVPVAEVVFVLQPEDGLGEGYVMECLAGESIPRKILRNPEFQQVRPQLASQCGEVLAQIHQLAIPADLPKLSVEEQIAELEAQYREYQYAVPAFELAFRWLKSNQPSTNEQKIVHGDFRNGNLLVAPERGLSGVLDWELCHVGDPMEDLGWLCVNSWRFGNRHLPVGGFGARAELFSAYQRVSGVTVDPQQVYFWELYGVLKWGVICLYMCNADLQGGGRSVERAAIGRRISETEVDLLTMLTGRGV